MKVIGGHILLIIISTIFNLLFIKILIYEILKNYFGTIFIVD